MNSPIYFIVGPTGVGKSDVSLLLAKHLNGEIINADAMQVYRGIDIASDKPSLALRQEIPHHVIDVVDVSHAFNVEQYRQLANAAIEDVLKRGKTPIIVGGSGMYVTVLLDGIFEGRQSDEPLREKLFEEAMVHGPEVLHQRLAVVDHKAAAKIHPNDTKRIVRALEVVTLTGQPISELQPQRQGLWGKYTISLIGLNRDRDLLYRRVEARIEEMFKRGLVDEIKAISDLPISRTAHALIGIPEVLGLLNGTHDLERAKYVMKLKSRHLAKRQLTWFRRDERIQWIDIAPTQTADDVFKAVCQLLHI